MPRFKVSQDDIDALLRNKQDVLKEQCRLRGLKVGGNKTQLAVRFLTEVAKPAAPSAAQMQQIAQLERRLGLPVSAKSFSSKAEATKRLEQLNLLTQT